MFKFTHGTHCVRAIIAQQLLVATSPVYYETQQQVLDDQFSSVNKALSTRIGEIVQMTQDKQNQINQAACDKLTFKEGNFSRHQCDGNWTSESTYDPATAICSVHQVHKSKNCCGWGCDFYTNDTRDKSFPMPKVTRDDMREGLETAVTKDVEDYVKEGIVHKD